MFCKSLIFRPGGRPLSKGPVAAAVRNQAIGAPLPDRLKQRR